MGWTHGPSAALPLLEAVPDPLELASNDRVTGVGVMDLEIEAARESVPLLDQQQSASTATIVSGRLSGP